jgi:hypothetical protein
MEKQTPMKNPDRIKNFFSNLKAARKKHKKAKNHDVASIAKSLVR